MSQKVYKTLGKFQRETISEGHADVFLVTGKNSFYQSGAYEMIPHAKKFYDFSSNPKIEDVIKGIEIFNSISPSPELIVAIGGGSVIDMAKLIKGLCQEKNPEKSIKENRLGNIADRRMIAIPTTAGSGSESTPFAVVYLNGKKYSLQHEKLLPDEIVLDYTLTKSMSPRLTAVTGMDALSQAIEAYWSINSNGESKQYSRDAMDLILSNLETAVNHPTNESRKGMLLGANLAGKAIAIAKTTACHSISYPITSNFGIPHGHAVALTLGEILEYNSQLDKDCNDSRGSDYVKKTISELPVTKDLIHDLMKDIGLETRLSDLGIDKKDIGLIVKEGFNPQRMKNNPREITRDDLRKILEEIY